MAVVLCEGDCLDIIPRLVAKGVVVDAIVTDPPYHLTNGNIAFDWANIGSNGAKRPNVGETNKGGRKAGFMGQRWDGGDIAFRPETWAIAASVLRPGGFLLAFGGTRRFHRLACAIEDAGFVIQDTIMWLYGQGFPKGRTQLKPAWEPIIVAYKPGGKRTLQVEECRITGLARPLTESIGDLPSNGIYGEGLHGSRAAGKTAIGRWPANVCHDGSDEVMAAFAAFGEKDSRPVRPENIGKSGSGKAGSFARSVVECGYYDTGSAARFFYCAKADKQDRWGSKHPTIKPVELMKWLVALVTSKGGLVLDPFAGSGTTGVAALGTGRNAILIEREAEYQNDIRERIAHYEGEGRHSLAVKNRSRVPREASSLL